MGIVQYHIWDFLRHSLVWDHGGDSPKGASDSHRETESGGTNWCPAKTTQQPVGLIYAGGYITNPTFVYWDLETWYMYYIWEWKYMYPISLKTKRALHLKVPCWLEERRSPIAFPFLEDIGSFFGGSTPQKFNIDTKNWPYQKRDTFSKAHRFGYPAVSFQGCNPYEMGFEHLWS